MPYCTECGAKIENEDLFCSECGAPQKEDIPSKTTEQPKKEEEKIKKPIQKKKSTEIKPPSSANGKKYILSIAVTTTTILVLLILIAIGAIIWMLIQFQQTPSYYTLQTQYHQSQTPGQHIDTKTTLSCGDGQCRGEETCVNCPTDCGQCSTRVVCGDSVCESSGGEDSSSCCLDCGCPSDYSCDRNSCKKLAQCGDGVCSTGDGESQSNCCKDCGCLSIGYYCEQGRCASKCGDGIKTSEENSENCCKDARCEHGYSCVNNRCVSECGDGIQASDETQENCCRDAGCPTGYTCKNNACVELKPKITTTFKQTNYADSVTYLRARGDNVGYITLSNTGNDNAKNVKVIISSPDNYFGQKTIDAESISPDTSIEKTVDLNFLESILEITSAQTLQLNVRIVYYNSANKKDESYDTYKINVKGRNYFLWAYPQMISSWVTPNQNTVREFASRATGGLATYRSTTEQMMAARWIFESMKAYGVEYTTDAHVEGDYVQFPLETLKNKGGDCEDNAILYASLLEAIGLESVIILVPGHAFSGFINKDDYLVPIETTATNFDQAWSSGLSKYKNYQKNNQLSAVVHPSKYWSTYPQVILPEKTPIKMPYITKQIGECDATWNLDKGFIAKIPVTFTNSGSAPGAGCAAVDFYDNKNVKIGEDYTCWVINPRETKTEEYTADISMGTWMEGYRCQGY